MCRCKSKELSKIGMVTRDKATAALAAGIRSGSTVVCGSLWGCGVVGSLSIALRTRA